MNTQPLFNPEEIKKAISFLREPQEVFELRLVSAINSNKKPISGYFINADTAIEQLAKIRGLEQYNVYITLQEILPENYARAQRDKFLDGVTTTNDKEAKRFKWLLIDLDPSRLSAISSSKEELTEAYYLGVDVANKLANFGFGKPATALSGNGLHLLYKINLPTTEENKELVHKVLQYLDVLFSTDKIKVDTSVFNPAQPCKIYGSIARKGANTEERPHRQAKILQIPPDLKEIPRETLEKVAKLYKGDEKKSGKKGGNFKKWTEEELEQFFNEHNIEFNKKSISGGMKYFVPNPWFEDITDEGVILWDSGELGYAAKHDRTVGKYNIGDYLKFYGVAPKRSVKTADASTNIANTSNEALELITTNEGRIIDCIENAVRILTHDGDVGGKFRLNLFDRNIWIKCNAGECLPWRKSESNYRKYDNDDEAYLYRYLERNYNIKKAEKIDKGLRIAAREYAFNPIEELLNGTQWDGQPRIKTLLHDYLGAEANEYTAQVMQLVMLGAINRALKPGCKFDYVLIFVGSQGKYKSSFARLLAMDDNYFCDSLDKLGDKSAAEQLQGKWLVELPELKALKRTRERETIKSFITQTCDTYRPAYGKVAEDYPRTCVFIGTTNDDDFLTDPTGNRRFLPVQIDVTTPTRKLFDKETRAYIQQAWAEAMEIYRKGEYSLLIPDSLLETVEKVREQYIEEDPDRAIIEEWLKDKTQVCTNQLFWDALGNKQDFSKFDRREAARLNDIMKTFKDWKRGKGKKSFKPYGQCRYYQKVRLTYDNQAEKVGQVETATDGFLTMSDDEEQPF